MFAELLSESIRRNSSQMLQNFPKIFLSDHEAKAVEWILTYKREFENLPSIERFRDTEFGVYYTERYNGSPLADLYAMALDKKREAYFFSQVHSMEEKIESGIPLPPSSIVQLGHDLSADGRTTFIEYDKLDRHSLYDGMSEDGVKFGWGNIDTESGGLIPGEFGILVARPGVGKTWISCFLSMKWYKERKRVLFESFEMPDASIISRMDAIIGEFNSKIMRTADGRTRELLITRIEAKIKEQELLGGKILFPIQKTDDRESASGRKSRKSMKAQYIDTLYDDIEQQKPDIVVADGIYLAKVMGMSPAMPEWQKVKATSNMFKQIALDTGVVVFGTSQLKRTGKVDDFNLDDIAYADALGQDADMVISLNKDSDISHIMYLTMMKNRNGGALASATMHIDFDKSSISEEGWK